jgi:hypothetical protein
MQGKNLPPLQVPPAGAGAGQLRHGLTSPTVKVRPGPCPGRWRDRPCIMRAQWNCWTQLPGHVLVEVVTACMPNPSAGRLNLYRSIPDHHFLQDHAVAATPSSPNQPLQPIKRPVGSLSPSLRGKLSDAKAPLAAPVPSSPRSRSVGTSLEYLDLPDQAALCISLASTAGSRAQCWGW